MSIWDSREGQILPGGGSKNYPPPGLCNNCQFYPSFPPLSSGGKKCLETMAKTSGTDRMAILTLMVDYICIVNTRGVSERRNCRSKLGVEKNLNVRYIYSYFFSSWFKAFFVEEENETEGRSETQRSPTEPWFKPVLKYPKILLPTNSYINYISGQVLNMIILFILCYFRGFK